MRDVLRNISEFRQNLCQFMLITIYAFVPPVIRLPVLAVMDARLRPLLVNLINQKNRFFEFDHRFL